jgi:hypothetical protein
MGEFSLLKRWQAAQTRIISAFIYLTTECLSGIMRAIGAKPWPPLFKIPFSPTMTRPAKL